jgi:hypothetical protein
VSVPLPGEPRRPGTPAADERSPTHSPAVVRPAISHGLAVRALDEPREDHDRLALRGRVHDNREAGRRRWARLALAALRQRRAAANRSRVAGRRRGDAGSSRRFGLRGRRRPPRGGPGRRRARPPAWAPRWRDPGRQGHAAGDPARVPPAAFPQGGGAEGDRTPDPETASLVLSQLSYSPAGSGPYRAVGALSRRPPPPADVAPAGDPPRPGAARPTCRSDPVASSCPDSRVRSRGRRSRARDRTPRARRGHARPRGAPPAACPAGALFTPSSQEHRFSVMTCRRLRRLLGRGVPTRALTARGAARHLHAPAPSRPRGAACRGAGSCRLGTRSQTARGWRNWKTLALEPGTGCESAPPGTRNHATSA